MQDTITKAFHKHKSLLIFLVTNYLKLKSYVKAMVPRSTSQISCVSAACWDETDMYHASAHLVSFGNAGVQVGREWNCTPSELPWYRLARG